MKKDDGDAPELLASRRIEPASSLPLVGFILAAVLAGAAGLGIPHGTSRAVAAAYTRADLGATLVTPIDLADPSALARAMSWLRLADDDRRRLSAELDAGRLRLGLLAFFDDEEPDGDAVDVRGAGFGQRITLGSGLSVVVAPYAPGGPIEITAVADGGDIATVAMVTKSGPVHLKRMFLGETIGVATP